MDYSRLREQLKNYYWQGDKERSISFAEHCFAILDEKYREGMTVTEQKLLQYEVISNEFTPVLFADCPYYFETGALDPYSVVDDL